MRKNTNDNYLNADYHKIKPDRRYVISMLKEYARHLKMNNINELVDFIAVLKRFSFDRKDRTTITMHIYYQNCLKDGHFILKHAFRKVSKNEKNLIFNYFAHLYPDDTQKSIEDSFLYCNKKISQNDQEQLKDEIKQLISKVKNLSFINLAPHNSNSDNDDSNLNSYSNSDNILNSTLDHNDNNDSNFDLIANDSNIIDISGSNTNIVYTLYNNFENYLANDIFNQDVPTPNLYLNSNDNSNTSELNDVRILNGDLDNQELIYDDVNEFWAFMEL